MMKGEDVVAIAGASEESSEQSGARQWQVERAIVDVSRTPPFPRHHGSLSYVL
jgi:hypothetical protein